MRYIIKNIVEDWGTGITVLSLIEVPEHIEMNTEEYDIALHELMPVDYECSIDSVNELLLPFGIEDYRDAIGKYFDLDISLLVTKNTPIIEVIKKAVKSSKYKGFPALETEIHGKPNRHLSKQLTDWIEKINKVIALVGLELSVRPIARK